MTAEGRLTISPCRSRCVRVATCMVIIFVGRSRHRSGIVVVGSAPLRTRAAHLVTQEGDNRDDDRRAHEERRDQRTENAHLGAVPAGMNTTLAAPGRLAGGTARTPRRHSRPATAGQAE